MPLPPLNFASTNHHRLSNSKMMIFGGGNFVRAFILYFLNEYNKTAADPFGAMVVKVTPGDYKDWKHQEGLYHVLSKGLKDGEIVDNAELISCVTELISAYDEWGKLIEFAENPDIQFLVNNVTESGLVFIEEPMDKEIPESFPAKLTKWLLHRFHFFEGDRSKGCIILPCELIENNADLLKGFIMAYIKFWKLSAEFETWINEACIFCNTLVDRIVPGVNKAHLLSAQEKVGHADALITEGEPYHIFVIEADEKVATSLPWHLTLNLQIIYTQDLSEYRIKKIRILNGPHSSLVPVGLLCGFEIVREVMEDELLSNYVEHLMYQEIIPILPLDKQELITYAKDTLDRFRNPFLHHKLATISLNSFAKARVRIIPTIKENIQINGEIPEGTLLALASMIVLYKGKYHDLSFDLKDDPYVIETMSNFWSNTKENSLPSDAEFHQLFENEKLWGEDLNQIPGLEAALSIQIKNILTNNMIDEIKKAIE